MTSPESISADIMLAQADHNIAARIYDRFMNSSVIAKVALAGAISVAGIGVGLEASSGGNHHNVAAAASNQGNGQAETKAAVSDNCKGLEKYAVSTTPPSIYGQMYKQLGSGKQKPYSANEASDQVMGQTCFKQLPLAVTTTLYGFYENQAQIPTDIAGSIKSNYTNLTEGSPQAITAQENAINFANILTPTSEADPFVVTSSTKKIVATETGFAIVPANLTNGKADGYRIAVNNQSNDPVVQQRYKNLGQIFEFASDGTVLINQTVQSASVSLENIPNESPSTNNPQTSQNNQQSSGGSPQGGGVTNNGKTNENLPGNANGTSTGTKQESTPGIGATPSGGPTGSAPGTTPGTSPNGAPQPTTPNTQPTTPNTQPTTPNTQPPPTTEVTSTVPPTTLPAYKPPVTTTTIAGLGNPMGGS
jgi:hypothetical protein